MPRAKDARNVTLYDAVAGRVDYEGFIHPEHAGATEELQDDNNGRTRRGNPVTPDEALFRARGAPDRYAENDIYAADRCLKPGQRLPDSDLLKAIHAYVSDYYSRGTLDGGLNDMRSMDETALLACGILLEEAAKELLGDNGDIVFTEPDKDGLFSRAHSTTNVGSSRPNTQNDERQHKRPRLHYEESSTTDSGHSISQNNRPQSLGIEP